MCFAMMLFELQSRKLRFRRRPPYVFVPMIPISPNTSERTIKVRQLLRKTRRGAKSSPYKLADWKVGCTGGERAPYDTGVDERNLVGPCEPQEACVRIAQRHRALTLVLPLPGWPVRSANFFWVEPLGLRTSKGR